MIKDRSLLSKDSINRWVALHFAQHTQYGINMRFLEDNEANNKLIADIYARLDKDK